MAVEVVVIGGGPAGLEAARAAASVGASVTLVCDGKIGGRAGWHSLLPSKAWLNAAYAYQEVLDASKFGIKGLGQPQFDAPCLLKQITSVAEAWNGSQEDSLRDLDVKFVKGVASFVSGHEILVKEPSQGVSARLVGDVFILATGSIPKFPAGLKPDGKRVIAPRFVSHLSEIPSSVIVIGAGATGVEFVSLFVNLGAEVTWIIDEYGVLPAFDDEAGQSLRAFMKHRGVRVVEPAIAERIDSAGDIPRVRVSSGESFGAEMVFVAVGRTPDLERLNLDAAGLRPHGNNSLGTDSYGRTEIKWIYLIGDAAGSPMIANRAMAQGWVARIHAAGGNVKPVLPEAVVHAVYSSPEVAQVGNLRSRNRVTVQYEGQLKSRFSDHQGLLKLAFDVDRRITGAVAIGPHAADTLAIVALAIQTDAAVDDLAAVFGAHPTFSELPSIAARMSLSKGMAVK